MAKSKPGVMIYFETGQAIKGLDYETKGRLFEAIMEYGEHGSVPPLDGVLAAVWPFIANSIDRDAARYEELVEKKRMAGRASAAKRQAQADASQQVSTGVDECQQIQPTPTPSSTPSPTPTRTLTSTSTATPAGALNPWEKKYPHGCYQNVFLTDAEYNNLMMGIPGAEAYIEKLSAHIQSTGRNYDSHEATIRKWAIEDEQKRAAAYGGKPPRSGNIFYDIAREGTGT